MFKVLSRYSNSGKKMDKIFNKTALFLSGVDGPYGPNPALAYFLYGLWAFTLLKSEKRGEKGGTEERGGGLGGESQERLYEVCKAWFFKKKKKRCLLTTVVEDT